MAYSIYNCSNMPISTSRLLWIYREAPKNKRHQKIMKTLGEVNRITQNIQSYNRCFLIPPPHTISESISWYNALDSWVSNQWNWSSSGFTADNTTIKYIILSNFDCWNSDAYEQLAILLHTKWEKITGNPPRIGESMWNNITIIAVVDCNWTVPVILCNWTAPLICLANLDVSVSSITQ